MNIGVEINMVVADSVGALRLYEDVFDARRIEVTAYERGSNEAVFTIHGTRFHLLDENERYGLLAPKEGERKAMWLNVLVPDIASTFEKGLRGGFAQIQPVTELPGMGASNAIVLDPFGYVWLLHQIHRQAGFEERAAAAEERFQ